MCGSREWTDAELIAEVVAKLPDQTMVVQGGAQGADTLAKKAARDRLLWVATVEVPPGYWDHYGRKAGHLRNAAMLSLNIDYVYAFWDGRSRGTAGMLNMAQVANIPLSIYYPDGCVYKEP
jgi:hypothetical protein